MSNRFCLLTVSLALVCLQAGCEKEVVEVPQEISGAPIEEPRGDTGTIFEEDTPESVEANRDDMESFLQVDYEPLQQWMGERFQVSYREMTPKLIFDQVPLSDIHYQVEDLEQLGKVPAFDFKSENISRRALLKEIADHWGLDMKVVVDDSGYPSAVKVFRRP